MEPVSKRWVIYSTFDESGRAASHAVEQVRAYQRAGFDTLVIDISPHVSKERKHDWNEVASKWIRRPNTGYDFMSYREGLFLLCEMSSEKEGLDVLFTNDSCFGPFTPMADVFRNFYELDESRNTVFGITDSYEKSYHLQSYWLLFKAPLLHLAIKFFASMVTAQDRDEAIVNGELALSRYLLDEGCVLKAFNPVESTVRHFAHFKGRFLSPLELGLRRFAGRPKFNDYADKACLKYLLRRRDFACDLNQTLAFGVHMFKKNMTPFVKRKLISENPYADPAIPAGLDVAKLSNETLADLLSRRRSE